MVDLNVNKIKATLHEFEDLLGVKILHACEAGSRSWGMESTDSDFDVRFIYVEPDERWLMYKQPEDHLVHMTGKSHPEDPSLPLDFVGWEVRKALGLLAKSSGALLEHLRSRIKYRNAVLPDGRALWTSWLQAFEAHGDLGKVAHHYIGHAESHVRKYMGPGKATTVKQALYVLRCIYSFTWIHQTRSLPQINFRTLLGDMEEKRRSRLFPLVSRLLEMKVTVPESELANLTSAEKKLLRMDFTRAHGSINASFHKKDFPVEELERLLLEARNLAKGQ